MKKILLFILSFLFISACSVIKTYDEIDYNQFNKMIEAKNDFVLFVGSDSCLECDKYNVTLNKAIDKYGVDVKYINISLLSKIDKSSFVSVVPISNTPVTVFIEKGIEVSRISGNVKYSKIVSMLKENNYIKG